MSKLGLAERIVILAVLALFALAAWATFSSPQAGGQECGRWPSPGWTMEDVDQLAGMAEVFGAEGDADELREAARDCSDALDRRKTIAIGSVGIAVVLPFAMAFLTYQRRRDPAA